MRALQTSQVPIWVATNMFLALVGCGGSATSRLPDGAAPSSLGGGSGGNGGNAQGGGGDTSKGSGGTSGSMSINTGGLPSSGGNVIGGTKGTGNGHREACVQALEVFSEWKSIYVDFSGRLQRAQID